MITTCPIPSYNDEEDNDVCKEIDDSGLMCSYRSDGKSGSGRDSIGKCEDICYLENIPAKNHSCVLGKIEKCRSFEFTNNIGDDECIDDCSLAGVPGLGK